MIIYTPLDLPNIYPDDWDRFWNIWNNHAKLMKKKNPEKLNYKQRDIWIGLDIFNRSNHYSSWETPFYDISKELPNFYNSLLSLPVPNIYRIRIVQSILDVFPHTDNNLDYWEIRGFLYCKDPQSQWYFTRPDQRYQRYYIQQPQETMWFSYNDKFSWHGTCYNPESKKFLLKIFYVGNIKNLVINSIEKYKEYTISFD